MYVAPWKMAQSNQSKWSDFKNKEIITRARTPNRKHDPILLYRCAFLGLFLFGPSICFVLFHSLLLYRRFFCECVCALCMCVNVYSFSFEMLMHYITLHFILRAVNLWDREWLECCLFVRKKGVFEWLILHFYSIPFHSIFALRSPNKANKFFGTFDHTHVWDA